MKRQKIVYTALVLFILSGLFGGLAADRLMPVNFDDQTSGYLTKRIYNDGPPKNGMPGTEDTTPSTPTIRSGGVRSGGIR